MLGAVFGWTEIEQLQQQITLVPETEIKVKQLLKNLLTSYYIFVGELESLYYTKLPQEPEAAKTNIAQPKTAPNTASKVTTDYQTELEPDFEPFEYFVDFDAPSGQPLTDEDLYG